MSTAIKLPASFAAAGFKPPDVRRGILIGTDGPSNSGKTEFALSVPGWKILLACDKGFRGAMRNPTPPASRDSQLVVDEIEVPLSQSQPGKSNYAEYWSHFYDKYKKALANPDANCIIVDGDSDTFELQRLAEWGAISNVSLAWAGLNAARRQMYAKAYASRKIIISTNKISKHYKSVLGPDGKSLKDDKGKEVREWDGTWERQGFQDQEYLWEIQLSHLFEPARHDKILKRDIPMRWGIRITMCKTNRGLEGMELWGDDCNFRSLMETVYPNIPLSNWGF